LSHSRVSFRRLFNNSLSGAVTARVASAWYVVNHPFELCGVFN